MLVPGSKEEGTCLQVIIIKDDIEKIDQVACYNIWESMRCGRKKKRLTLFSQHRQMRIYR